MSVEIVGRSRALRRAVELADRFAPTEMPILLVGETGTGKELFARRIHEVSGRRGAFVPVNCAALPRDMVESLLFGHRRGAFTGAVEAVIGFIEAADGGTLFLDEVSSLPVEAQAKLLRVLETKDVNRLGETKSRRVAFRVVAAAQEDVGAQVEAGVLRGDLYQRLAGLVLELAPLRARPDDIVPLAEYLAGLDGRKLEAESIPVLLSYGWPGNVRELRTTIERAGFLAENGTLAPRELVEAIALGAPGGGQVQDVHTHGLITACREREQLFAACEANRWHAGRTANALGVARVTLYRRLRAAGLALRAQKKLFRLSGHLRDASSNGTPLLDSGRLGSVGQSAPETT